MYYTLGLVEEKISDTELRVYSIFEDKDFIVKASKEYVSSVAAELNDEDGETIMIEFDLETKIVKEDIE